MFIEIFQLHVLRSIAINYCYKNITQPPINRTITDSLPFTQILLISPQTNQKKRKKNLLNSLLRQRSINKVIHRFETHISQHPYIYICISSINYRQFILSFQIYYNHFRAKRLYNEIHTTLSLYIYTFLHAETTLSFSTKFRTSQSNLPPPRSARQTRTTIYLTPPGTIVSPLPSFNTLSIGGWWRPFLPLFNCASLYICNDGCCELFRSFALGTKKN